MEYINNSHAPENDFSDVDDPDWGAEAESDNSFNLPNQTVDPEDQEDLRDIFSDFEDSGDEIENDSFIPDIEHEPIKFSKRSRKGKGGAGAGGKKEIVLSPEVEHLIHEGLQAYMAGDHNAAIDYSEEALRLEPRAHRAHDTLAAVYDDLGDYNKLLTSKGLAASIVNTRESLLSVADLSRDLGYFDQATHYYELARKRSKTAEEKLEVNTQLAAVYEASHQYSKAVNKLRQIRRQSKDPQLLLQIAQNLVSAKRITEAVNLYDDLLKRNKEAQESEDKPQNFGLSELNVLAELYYKQNSFPKAIKAIKQTVRWLAGRESESWWDNFRDDTEYLDEKREKVEKFQNSPYKDEPEMYDLAIDIRMKLLMCRAKMGDIETAKEHLQYLLVLPAAEYEDLYFEVAKVFLEVGEPEIALDLLMQRYEAFDEQDPENQMALYIAKSNRELGNFKEAEKWYKVLLNSENRTLDSLVELAEMYDHCGQHEDAQDLMNQIEELRQKETDRLNESKERVVEGEEDSSLAGEDAGAANDEALIRSEKMGRKTADGKPRTNKHPRRMTRSEREIEQKTLELQVKENFKAFTKYLNRYRSGDLAILPQLRRRMNELWQVFDGHKKFFPQQKTKVYTGETFRKSHTRKKTGGMDLDERIERITARIKDAALEQDNAEADADAESAAAGQEGAQLPKSFRTLSFDEWFEVCMNRALIETKEGNSTVGLKVAERCLNANVFYQDDEKRDLMDWVLLAIHIKVDIDPEEKNTVLRRLINNHQLYNDSFRLYSAVLASGSRALEVFSNNNNQKYFMRQLKAVDSLVSKKHVGGAAKIHGDIEMDKENPILLTLYSHIMLGGRSYLPALGYLNRAMGIKPKDSMILLTIGVVHIHRALQRQTTNRHLQIMEGFSFLLEYHDVRSKQGPGEAQEADFNIARTFHLLALPSLAIEYYKRVLEHKVPDPNFDMSGHAAYNLHLIYAQSGNPKLARQIVDKYLVI